MSGVTRAHWAAIVTILVGLDVTALSAQQVSPRVPQPQPTQSFAELQSILKSGDAVRVKDSSGTITQGRIDGVSASSLGLNVNGRRLELPEAGIREIERRRPDSRWNGALIGAAIGAAVGAVAKARNCGATDCGEGGLVDPGLYVFGAGIGAGAGALVDFSIKRFDTVYAGHSTASGRRFRLSPVLSSRTKGLGLSVTF